MFEPLKRAAVGLAALVSLAACDETGGSAREAEVLTLQDVSAMSRYYKSADWSFFSKSPVPKNVSTSVLYYPGSNWTDEIKGNAVYFRVALSPEPSGVQPGSQPPASVFRHFPRSELPAIHEDLLARRKSARVTELARAAAS